MPYRQKCELEIEYKHLPEDYKKRIEEVIRNQFHPQNYAQIKSRQGLAFLWPMFTAVQCHARN